MRSGSGPFSILPYEANAISDKSAYRDKVPFCLKKSIIRQISYECGHSVVSCSVDSSPGYAPYLAIRFWPFMDLNNKH